MKPMRSVSSNLDQDQSPATIMYDNLSIQVIVGRYLVNRLSGVPAEDFIVFKKESKSVNAIARLKSDHRRVKTPDRESEGAHASKRRERRVEQHWAAQVAEESFYLADYGNAL